MKIVNNSPITQPVPTESIQAKKTKTKEVPAATYEKSAPAKKANYNKPIQYNKASISKLKQKSEQSYRNLKLLIESMLKKQKKTVDWVELNENAFDETNRLEAEKLIGPDGPLGAEAVSNRLVEFAIAISGGDKSKYEELKSAIDKGFKEVEKMLGKLPEVSQETYRLTMEKLSKWAGEVEEATI